MAVSLTDAELTILGLIAERPRHGYELENVIEERGIRNWTALGFSSIYYVLDKLAQRGLIEPISSERSGKARATFRLAALGRRVHDAASVEALTALSPARARVLIGLANSEGLARDEVLTALSRRVDAVGAQLSELRAARSEQEPLPTAAAAIFAYSEAMLVADVHWAETTLATLKKENSMEKYDIKKAHAALYAPSAKEFAIVHVPELHYIAIDGQGDPNTSSDYAEAIESLYSVAYALKFASKKDLERDMAVGPLEGLWRAKDMTAFISRERDQWDWTMMISRPEWITPEMVSAAIEKVSAKKKLGAQKHLHSLSLTEGDAVQILHIGSYDDETPVLDELHNRFLPDNDLVLNGDHHEVYLSDPRRTAPAKLKTVLRQPVKPR